MKYDGARFLTAAGPEGGIMAEDERERDDVSAENVDEREQALDDKLKMLYAMIRAANPHLLDNPHRQGNAEHGH